ncbi:hypothetical protein QFZ76_000649 [Streptomyces sp. V4I2]|nr:hypothetical protein [Streptomyces sp. V4I2]
MNSLGEGPRRIIAVCAAMQNTQRRRRWYRLGQWLSPVVVAGAAAGVTWHRSEARVRGQTAGAHVTGQVADDRDQFSAEDRPHAGEQLDDLGAFVERKVSPDLLVGVLDPLVQCEGPR